MGLGIDSVSMTVFIPSDKAAEIASLLHSWNTKRDASRSEAKRLAGKLQFLARAVKAGRTFSRRILDLVRAFPASASAHRPRLIVPEELALDLQWWAQVLVGFPQRVPILQPTPQPHELAVVTSDSSGGRAGAWLRTPKSASIAWLSYEWTADVRALAASEDRVLFHRFS